MITASHNPAKYNGFKAYGPDGCQMTDDAAAIVYDEIQKTDILGGAKYVSFATGVEEGYIRFCGDDCKKAFYAAIEERQVRPGLCKTAGLKLVYSPLNGAGLVPVTRVLNDIGITDITIVPEQEYPNGYFTTCSYPNPEIFAALELGLNLAKESGADLMLATDPDADRVGIAMKCPDGSYELVSGNEVGVLLLDYISAGRIEKGTMPKNPVAVKSIVSTPLADAVAKMTAGEHAEVQYPWHCPCGETWIVRCGGVRNPEYTKGIRIEGTHQNVTALIHFDEKERARAKKLESDLAIEKIRTEALSFIADHEPNLDEALNFFGKHILEFTGCDQVIFHEVNGKRILLNAPGISDLPQETCSRCPITDFSSSVFGENDTICINDCNDGYRGVTVHPDCPTKSAYMQRIYSGGELAGLFSIHYINEQHTFTENEIEILKMVAVCLGLMIGRVKEKQEEIARIEAESSSKAKTEFLFNMSHDIRTPMNAIIGYTDIAMNHIDESQRVRDSLNKIKVSSGHLLKLINDILEMSRIEAGKMEIVKEPINIKAASDGVSNMSQSLADKKDITFKTIVGDLKNPYIYADELHTNQVLINIISNAIKYTNPGGTVLYQIEQLDSPADGIAWYRFTVSDNGIGMSGEFQKHIFESFSREQSATVSKLEGTGLGLAIVKKIVDKIGGKITVRSTLGEGSTFIVELPFEVMDDKSVEEFAASHREETSLLETISFEGLKALLVEDNEMNREIAAEILEETGLQLETAEDGAIAVGMVSEKGTGYYDFILMDIQMPVMDGFEATAKIRELPGGSEIPIIALSANAFKEDVDRSLAAGMNAHAVKPIDVKALFETIQQLLK